MACYQFILVCICVRCSRVEDIFDGFGVKTRQRLGIKREQVVCCVMFVQVVLVLLVIIKKQRENGSDFENDGDLTSDDIVFDVLNASVTAR